ncbi:hypothetical protein BC751_3912 [Cecembia calidifontis]|uniref:Glycosyltransferase RgtA/B/C/D-like domain-containing protein n=2 Tax=Cecembia calidifontis TaxID=1187080 RepID=A0A4Q7PD34_9BACT|nr:hypothetical protein BC751_3912 [Cecembia calidifontis]
MASEKNTLIILSLLFFMITASIFLRACAGATNYQSPDSFFYLQAAENLLTGKGMVAPYTYPFDATSPVQYFAIWPIGYPLLIAALGLLIPDLLWASKVVNLLFLAGMVILLYKRFGKFGPWAALAFVSYGMMEVYSHTWSEGPFLFFVLAFVVLLEKNNTSKYWKILTLVLIGLFTLRYAGIIFWAFLFFHFLYTYFYLGTKKQKHYAYTLALSALYLLAYLGFNYWQTGHLTGAPRIYPGQESTNTFLYYLGRGVLNIFAFARNFWSFGAKDILALVLFLFQLLVVFFLIKKTGRPSGLFQTLPFQVAIFYLLGIIFLRIISPFDAFDFRILSPIVLLLYVYGLAHLGQLVENVQKKKVALLSFLTVSWLVNLPNKFLWDKWLGLWG